MNQKLEIEVDTSEEIVNYLHVQLSLLVELSISTVRPVFGHLLFKELLVEKVICAEQIDITESAKILELCLHKLCLVQLHQLAIMT